MEQFEQRLFIGIGKTNAYYTLRETYLHREYLPGEGPNGNSVINGVYQGKTREEVRSFHHFNLSQDVDEAIAKAKEASIKLGLPIYINRDKLEEDMREIRRRTAEEIEAHRIEEEERVRVEEEVRRNRWLEREQRNIKEFEETGHYMQGGKYEAWHMKHLPRSYCAWIAEKASEFDPESFMAHVAKTLISQYADRIPEKVELHPTRHFGEIKKRYDLDLTVVESFSFEGNFGRTYVTKMADADGTCFCSMSGSFSAELGEKLKIKATVINHGEYKGQAQTMINRVKVIQE